MDLEGAVIKYGAQASYATIALCGSRQSEVLSLAKQRARGRSLEDGLPSLADLRERSLVALSEIIILQSMYRLQEAQRHDHSRD